MVPPKTTPNKRFKPTPRKVSRGGTPLAALRNAASGFKMQVQNVVTAFLLLFVLGHSDQPKAETTKPHLNIGVIGAPSAGSRDLGIALFASATGRPPSETDFVGAGDVTYLEYDATHTHFAHALFKDHHSINFALFFQTLQSLDGVIFSLEHGKKGNMSILDQCLSAKAAGVPRLFIYVWTDGARQPRVDAETMALFSQCGYPSSSIHVVQGRARRQSSGAVLYSDVSALLTALTNDLTPRIHNPATIFALPIDDVFSISGRGTIVTGRVASGEVTIGNELVVVGLGRESKTSAVDIEMFRRKLTLARSGDHVGITLKGISRGDVSRGMVLTTPSAARQAPTFRVKLTFAQDEISGKQPSLRNTQYMFYTGTLALPVTVDLLPGQLAVIHATEPVPIIAGWPFALRKEGKTVAIGVIE